MDSGQIAPGPLNISDVIEVIANTDPDFVAHNMLDSMEDSRRRSMYVKILEQPASKALRFRYECEGRSAGSIPGVNSTPENKTFPTIQVVGYKGPAVVVVSCVTKDPPYRPHPHNLVGKEGCKKGICTMHISSETMTATFSNLGIQCVKKKDIEEALKIREEIRVDPFRTGFSHRSQPTSIDLNAVRLCFQVFIKDSDSNQFNIPLAPVVSEPIYDKKAMSDLVICKLSDCTCTVAGGKEIILLCEKVAKEDIQVHFYEEKDNQIVWEGLGDFQPTHVHKQVAISFRTPRYKSLEVSGPVKVNIQLRRPSDGATSEPLPFEYLPLDSDPNVLKRKRQKFNDGSNLQHFQESDKLCLQQGAGDPGMSVTMQQQILHHTLIKSEPMEPKHPSQYPAPGGSRSPMYQNIPVDMPPQVHTPALASPQSAGRTPSPYLEYLPTYQTSSIPGYENPLTYMSSRHSEFINAAQVTRSMQVHHSLVTDKLAHIQTINDLSGGGGGGNVFNSSSGFVTLPAGTSAAMLPGMGTIAQNPGGTPVSSMLNIGITTGSNQPMVMSNVNISGSNTVAMNVPSNHGTNNATTPGTSTGTEGENCLLDLDHQQYNFDSAELATLGSNLGLFEGNLSETLSSHLTLSENRQAKECQQAKDDVQENMSDSFTSLTKEIRALNELSKQNTGGDI